MNCQKKVTLHEKLCCKCGMIWYRKSTHKGKFAKLKITTFILYVVLYTREINVIIFHLSWFLRGSKSQQRQEMTIILKEFKILESFEKLCFHEILSQILIT